jgi:hypothetical protein
MVADRRCPLPDRPGVASAAAIAGVCVLLALLLAPAADATTTKATCAAHSRTSAVTCDVVLACPETARVCAYHTTFKVLDKQIAPSHGYGEVRRTVSEPSTRGPLEAVTVKANAGMCGNGQAHGCSGATRTDTAKPGGRVEDACLGKSLAGFGNTLFLPRLSIDCVMTMTVTA